MAALQKKKKEEKNQFQWTSEMPYFPCRRIRKWDEEKG